MDYLEKPKRKYTKRKHTFLEEDKPGDSTETFVPTDAQRTTVRLMKASDVKEEYIRYAILNPATKKCITNETFLNVFKEELMACKSMINAECLNSLTVALKSDDLKIRIDAAKLIRNLCTKGLYTTKFKLPKNLSSSQQIDLVMEALNESRINTYEAEIFLNGIKSKEEIQTKGDSTQGLTVNVDGKTIGCLAGVVKDLVS